MWLLLSLVSLLIDVAWVMFLEEQDRPLLGVSETSETLSNQLLEYTNI